MKKKLLTIILSILLCIGVAPTNVYAENVIDYTQPLEVECSSWADIKRNIDDIYIAEPTSDRKLTITLTGDITATDEDITLYVTYGMDVTIDLNGHVLNRNLINADGTTKDRPDTTGKQYVPDYYNYSYSGSVIEVWGGKLTIKDSSPNTEHVGFVDEKNLWHLGTGDGTSKTIKGGIITGGIGMIYFNSIN